MYKKIIIIHRLFSYDRDWIVLKFIILLNLDWLINLLAMCKRFIQ